MQLSTSVSINAPKEAIWQTITNIKDAAAHINGIEKVEILEKPTDAFVGLKWRETRTMFGKTATEVMWITESVENEYYKTRAESHGSVYETILSISGGPDTHELQMTFSGSPQSFGAKVMASLMGWMFKGATRKALQKDLEDIKKHVESNQ